VDLFLKLVQIESIVRVNAGDFTLEDFAKGLSRIIFTGYMKDLGTIVAGSSFGSSGHFNTVSFLKGISKVLITTLKGNYTSITLISTYHRQMST